jgi:uncharacterized protein (TIGR02145 family)
MKKSYLLSSVIGATLLGVFIYLSGCNNDDENNPPSTVTDIDGNVYHTVTIGTQVWMVENLKTTKFNDGTVIPYVSDITEWSNLNTPGYCYYNNDASAYKDVYGALYNWFTVNTGKLAPAGWHVPTNVEWTTLADYLGGDTIAGGKLKETGTTHWNSPNEGATNESGFTALPAGGRAPDGNFYNQVGNYCYWWTTTEYNTQQVWRRMLTYLDINFSETRSYKTDGISVRCIKDD